MYEWVKVLHILAVISWMAGLLYLPRLFVYHCGVSAGSEASETFKVMERRLMKAIMTPAMIVTWVFGLWLAYLTNAWGEAWFIAKLFLVIIMSAMHGFMVGWMKAFAADSNKKESRFFRFANEVPTLLMILIVILVIVKPF